jgi:hypothetical protein
MRSRLHCYAEPFSVFREKVKPLAESGDRVACAMLQGTEHLLGVVQGLHPEKCATCLCCGVVLRMVLLGGAARTVVGLHDGGGPCFVALACANCASVSNADLLLHFDIFTAAPDAEAGHA